MKQGLETENKYSIINSHLNSLIDETEDCSDLNKLLDIQKLIKYLRWKCRGNKKWKKRNTK